MKRKMIQKKDTTEYFHIITGKTYTLFLFALLSEM